MKKFFLILFIACSFISCKTDSSSNTNETYETWDFVFSDQDISGHWENKSNPNSTYSVDVSNIAVSIYMNDTLYKFYTGTNASLNWVKKCKTNQNKTKLIIQN